LDELELINAIQSLQKRCGHGGIFPQWQPGIYYRLHFGQLCGRPSPGSKNLPSLKRRWRPGAGFVVTPPVFDVERFACSLEKIAALDVPVIATVFLLKSVGIARYMALNEPGAHISEEMIKSIRKAPDRNRNA
jgi:methylenetetrahydrofolate reductase (NADPH)